MDTSTLATALTALRSAETTAAIQYAVAARLLRSQATQGQAVVEMIQAAGQNLDAAVGDVSSAISSGLDVYA